ncbi:TraR/DksA family transcriptional regulator [Inmirania thermothiophila]|uniref:TraR/DksA family transcriptional regulator n=1 Tax=Inmirania thermothiophila TaxID=1750597 RepID=A0A3N1Y2L0_9GAMM|nr:TraR/DksA family transcriptional regulator [Inmirania thermothiophila]ROR32748.1 TraR/DksA family transcriptional regulator [Inmirania thermothiophila]
MREETLKEADLRRLAQRLREREAALRARIAEELAASENARYIDLAGQVHDMEEAAVADLLVDVQLATIDRDVQELRRVEAALRRIREGVYGLCIDCGEPIDRGRLEADPAVGRCLVCQERHERGIHPEPTA